MKKLILIALCSFPYFAQAASCPIYLNSSTGVLETFTGYGLSYTEACFDGRSKCSPRSIYYAAVGKKNLSCDRYIRRRPAPRPLPRGGVKQTCFVHLMNRQGRILDTFRVTKSGDSVYSAMAKACNRARVYCEADREGYPNRYCRTIR